MKCLDAGIIATIVPFVNRVEKFSRSVILRKRTDNYRHRNLIKTTGLGRFSKYHGLGEKKIMRKNKRNSDQPLRRPSAQVLDVLASFVVLPCLKLTRGSLGCAGRGSLNRDANPQKVNNILSVCFTSLKVGGQPPAFSPSRPAAGLRLKKTLA